MGKKKKIILNVFKEKINFLIICSTKLSIEYSEGCCLYKPNKLHLDFANMSDECLSPDKPGSWKQKLSLYSE